MNIRKIINMATLFKPSESDIAYKILRNSITCDYFDIQHQNNTLERIFVSDLSDKDTFYCTDGTCLV